MNWTPASPQPGHEAVAGAPLVSVLMPARNAAATLAASVDSVRAQGLAEWELLIADDASTDATLSLARALAASDERIRVLDAPAGHAGAAQARNRALVVARGRYIAFLDADDLWHPDKLERQIAFMTETGAALSYTGYLRRKAGRDRRVRVPATVGYDELLRGNVIGCLTAVYDTALCGRAPMPPIPRRHDFALWLDILRRTGPARGLDLPLAVHSVSGRSLSANKLAATADTWRMYRDVIGLTRAQALGCLSSHLWRRATRRDSRAAAICRRDGDGGI